jgi:hypothetical protein
MYYFDGQQWDDVGLDTNATGNRCDVVKTNTVTCSAASRTTLSQAYTGARSDLDQHAGLHVHHAQELMMSRAGA